MYIFRNIYLYWIYDANNLGSICQLNIYDIGYSCQHLGDECKLEGFCTPFGRRVGEYTFLNIMLVLNISCQHLGEECKL